MSIDQRWLNSLAFANCRGIALDILRFIGHLMRFSVKSGVCCADDSTN